MQTWKFLLLGITGDLAKLKVLPALAKFAEQYQDKVQIDLLGYSRSTPDTDQIQKILVEASIGNSHCLNSLNLFQGQYTNAAFFDSLYEAATKPDERLIIYMAVPPNTFLQFLKNSCPHNDKHIDIIVEKPFGRDIEEAKEILKTVRNCHLSSKVHFLDHYLFKPQVQLSKAEITNLVGLKNKKIKQIEIKAYEVLGVGQRGSYYDEVGALKDMIPHLFALLNKTLQLLKTDHNLEIFEHFEVSDLTLGQYKSYTEEIQNQNSKTETYFKVKARIEDLDILFESGKKLTEKLTQITVDFEDKTSLVWNIVPQKELAYKSDFDGFNLSLDGGEGYDHVLTFKSILDEDYSHFPKHSEILTSWWVYEKIEAFKKINQTRLVGYSEGRLPKNTNPYFTPETSESLAELDLAETSLLNSLHELLKEESTTEKSGKIPKVQL